MQTPPEPDGLGRLSRFLAVAVLAGGIALRFLCLDADPHYYSWNGYITDEGRWIAHARAMVLFQSPSSVGWILHLLLAPLFQAVSYVVFELLGVSLLTSRLFTGLCGSALLVIFWASLRRSVSPEALLLALGMLAVETDLVVLSRLAVPEMAVMLLELAAYVLIATERGSSRRLFLAGLLMAAAVGMKATALPVVGIFAVILLLRPAALPDELSRRRALTSFVSGLGLPLLVAGVVFFGCCYREPAGLGETLRAVSSFVGLATPHMILSFPFDADLAPVLAIWALGAWLVLLGWLAIPPDHSEVHSRRLLASATIWAALYGAVMLLLEYFPSRYKVHILIPLAVIIAVGMSRIQAGGLGAIDTWLAALRGSRRLAALLVLALPTAALMAPLLAVAGTALVADPARLRVKLTCVLIALPSIVLLLHDQLRRGRGLSFFVLFPIVGGFAWLLIQRLTVSPPVFWPVSAPGAQAAWWPALLAAAMVATWLLLANRRGWRQRAGAVGIVAAAVGYVTLGLVQLAPGYLDPLFSMREASRDLGVLLAGSSRDIATANAEGLFNDNALPYRSILGDRWPTKMPEVIVIAFKFDDPQRLLEREYRLIRSYRIYVSPEYARTEDPWIPASEAEQVTVRVYRRIAGSS
jgi:hypothetical protein